MTARTVALFLAALTLGLLLGLSCDPPEPSAPGAERTEVRHA